MRFKAYRATNRLNGKVYIGITTTSIAVRWDEHVRVAMKGSKYGRFPFAIRKYGPGSFDVEHIASAMSWADLCEAEKRLIEQYGSFDPSNGYNATKGGEGAVGIVWTEETKRLRVASYKRTLESKGGCVLKGRARAPEIGIKMSALMKGRIFSAETKAKMAAGQKRRIFTDGERERFKRDGDKRRAACRALTGEQVTFLRNQRFEGVQFRDLSAFYGLALSSVASAAKGMTYTHVSMPAWGA